MKVVMCMVASVNGNIARPDGSMDWTSNEDKSLFVSLAKDIGVLITGKKTYDIVRKQKKQLDLALRVVVTDRPQDVEPQKNTVFTNEAPKKILEMIQKRGYEQVLVAGGGHINSLFLKENLIDEIHLTIEPVVLGQGVPLFKPDNMERRLELLEMTSLNPHTIHLHYKVLNNP